MKTLSANAGNISLAAAALRAGDLVGIPTETVYGLAGDATNAAAVGKIYAVKGRPANNPLIIHVTDTDSAMAYSEFNSAARALASVFWPGPLTLVSPKLEIRNQKSDRISPLALNHLQTVALRVPSHPIAQALLKEFNGPIAAPSANRSGELSPTQATHVAQAFNGLDQPKIILAGGRADNGLESTIVDCTQNIPRILRPGSITHEQLRAVVGGIKDFEPQLLTEHDTPNAPGQLYKHYAPRTKLRLNATDVAPNEVLLAFGPEPPWARRAKFALNLSAAGDLAEAAHNLFSHLHILDACNASMIAVMKIPDEGLGIAMNDRLQRAAN